MKSGNPYIQDIERYAEYNREGYPQEREHESSAAKELLEDFSEEAYEEFQKKVEVIRGRDSLSDNPYELGPEEQEVRKGVNMVTMAATVFWFYSMAENGNISELEQEVLDLAVFELAKFYFKDFYKTKHLPKIVEAVDDIRKTLLLQKFMEED